MQNVLNPEALCFQQTHKLNAQAPVFKPASKLNPQAPIFTPATPAFTFNCEAPCWMPRSEEDLPAKSPDCTGADTIHKPDCEESPGVMSPACIDASPIHESDWVDSAAVIEEELVHESDSDHVLGNEPAVDHVDPQPSFHHINWLGDSIEEKSFTKPATSLAVALSTGKLLCWEVEQIDESDFHKQICLRQAFRWLDPVVFTGDRRLLRTLSGTALENAAIGQIAKFYSAAGWWVDDHFEQHEDIPQWDHLDENYYNPNDVVFNGNVIDGDIRLPEEHYQEANQEVSRRCAGRSAYDEKKARGPRKSPLSKIWNASDITEYEAPLLNWADETEEDDWDGGNLCEELRRLREELHITAEEDTDVLPETLVDESRSPSLRYGHLQASSDEDALSTPPSSVTSDHHDELEEGNNDLGMSTETACKDVFPDQASLLECVGGEDMGAAEMSSSQQDLQTIEAVDDEDATQEVPRYGNGLENENGIAIADDSGEEATVIDTGTVIIHQPIKKPTSLELYIWTAPMAANPAPCIPFAKYEGQSTPTIRSKSTFTVGHTPTTASAIIQHMRQCSRRQGVHNTTIGKPTTAVVGATPINAASAIERARDITKRRKQEQRGVRKAWAWVKGWFDGRGSI